MKRGVLVATYDLNWPAIFEAARAEIKAGLRLSRRAPAMAKHVGPHRSRPVVHKPSQELSPTGGVPTSFSEARSASNVGVDSNLTAMPTD
jgi:hypothetical protein